MKKILTMVILAIISSALNAQKKPTLMAKKIGVTYPAATDGEALIKRLQNDIKEKNEVIENGWNKWFLQLSWCIKESTGQKLSIDQVKNLFFSNDIHIVKRNSDGLANTGLSSVTKEYVVVTMPKGDIYFLYAGKIPLLKLTSRQSDGKNGFQPCLNPVYSLTQINVGNTVLEEVEYESPHEVFNAPHVESFDAPLEVFDVPSYAQSEPVFLLPASNFVLPTVFPSNQQPVFWQQRPRQCGGNPPPTVYPRTCPVGQYLYTYPDGSTQCLSLSTSGNGTLPGNYGDASTGGTVILPGGNQPNGNGTLPGSGSTYGGGILPGN